MCEGTSTTAQVQQLVVGAGAVYVTERVIDTHIASLRRKIEKDATNPRHIITVRGVGYKLNRT